MTEASARPEAGPAGTLTDAVSTPAPSRVLTERIAATVLARESGWRLPRPSVLARRYQVPIGELLRALDELTFRHVLRRLPDGQYYRSSPAELLIPLEGIAGLGTLVDPMGGGLACRRYRVSRQLAEAEVNWTLGIPPGEHALTVELDWTSDGSPAAVSRTFLAESLAGLFDQGEWAGAEAPRGIWPLPSGDEACLPVVPFADCRPAALSLEMRAPPMRLARKIDLAPGQPAILIRLRFDDSSGPAAITIAVLRADMFRVALQSGTTELPGAELPAPGSPAS